MKPVVPLSALAAARTRWAAAQTSHALRGTPSREMQQAPGGEAPRHTSEPIGAPRHTSQTDTYLRQLAPEGEAFRHPRVDGTQVAGRPSATPKGTSTSQATKVPPRGTG